jgi:hypothetical protein
MKIDKEPSVYNVNHKNFIIMWSFLKGIAKERGLKEEDINIFEMLGLPFPKTYKNALQYYTDQTQWSTLETYVALYLKIKEITGDPNTFRNCGHAAAKYRKLFTWQQITNSLSGPSAAINYIPQIIPDWTDTTIFEIIRPAKYDTVEQKVTATVKYVIHPHIEPCDDYCSDPHILGLFEAIPANFPASLLRPWIFLPLGQARQFMNQYDPVKLYSGRFFKHLNLKPYFDNNKLYICDPNTNSIKNIGRKVILVSQELNGKMMYLGKSEPLEGNPPEGKLLGTLITETISFKGEPICESGVIMDAPYFLFNLYCQATKSARRAWHFRYFFTSKRTLLHEFFTANEKLKREIDDKNKAYNDLKYYSDNLENIVRERTELLHQTSEYLRQLDQVIMRVVSHGLGNWSANAIADAHLAIRSIKLGKINANTHEYLVRLVTNCGVAALAAIGLNYYCKKNIVTTVQAVTDFLLQRAHLSDVLDLQVDDDVKVISVDGRIYMILSEIFQNAIKAQINQGYADHFTMHIGLDASANIVKFILTNKGKLHGNLQILKSISDDFPDKHQGGWICKRLTKDLGGKITWTEEQDSVKVVLEVPVHGA